MIGETISHYEITDKLGEGGMGVVYKARHKRLERVVALKFLRPELVRTQKDKERFFREARVLAALDHPNICSVYDLDEVDGKAFIAMAFLEGNELRQLVKEGPVPADRALEIIRQVASGIQAAHEKNVIHRDIKSNNIIMTPQGVAKILDFGLARLSDRTMLTSEGTTMGTVVYMSPEQATGDIVDQRTDVWALGVLLHELITGNFPFHSDKDQAIIYLILNEDPKPLAEYRSDLPAGLQELIDKTLAKELDDRFESAAKLIEAIDDVRSGKVPTKSSQPTAPASAKTRTGPAPQSQPSIKVDPKTVAVFDFANISANPDDDWLSGGIAETLTADLKRVHELTLVPRTPIVQSMAGRSAAEITAEDVVKAGKAFGAKWAVWGGYQRFGESIRITANFSKTDPAELVDSCNTHGPMGDIFKLQDEIVSALTKTVEVKLTSSELDKIHQDETGDEQAYEYYARARHRTNTIGKKDFAKEFEEIEVLYKKALAIDPNYAPAHSGLGMLWTTKVLGESKPEDIETGKRCFMRAIEHDPEPGEAYTWLAFLYSKSEDLDDALETARKAVEIEDNHPVAHYVLAGELFFKGIGVMERWRNEYSFETVREGISVMRRSIELGPRFIPARWVLGWVYMMHGQYDSAMPELEKAVEIEESQRSSQMVSMGGALALYANGLLRSGRLDAARLAFQNALASMEEAAHPFVHTYRAQTHCGLGDIDYRMGSIDEAMKHYRQAVQVSVDSPFSAGIGYFNVRASAGVSKSLYAMGMFGEAKEALRRAAESLKSQDGFNFSFTFEACDALAYHQLASAHAALQQRDDAIASLAKAFQLGWRDLPQIDADPDLSELRDELSEMIDRYRPTEALP